jgi:serine/threonine-protein kinase RsbW
VTSRKPQSFKLIYSEVVRSDIRAVEPAVERLAVALKAHHCKEAQCLAADVSLREALANAILHGNGCDVRKHVELDCFQHGDGTLTLVVRDEGAGFDPAKLTDPTHPENVLRSGGRGIFLIRHFMDDVSFRRGGSEIRMKKRGN